MTGRRSPRPWHVTEVALAFAIEDAGGQRVAYVYFAEDAARGTVAGHLTRDEARRIAAGIARLPDLLAKEKDTGKA